MSKANIDTINEKYEYKTFNEVDEFTVALNNNKAIAGIGSDFQAITLIKKGFIQKINFEKLLNSQQPIKNQEELKEILKQIYTPAVFAHLESYDEELLTDEHGNNFTEPKHLWEYFVPYFHQEGVLAVNKLKSKKKNVEINEELFNQNLKELSSKSKLTNFNEQISSYSLFNMLNAIQKNGYDNLLITDAVRVNMLYGSPFQIKDNKIISNYGEIVDENNYKTLVNSFIDLITTSTNKAIDDSKISFNGDGQEILRTLLDMNRQDIDSSIMFNGDALDAYFSEDNELEYTDENGKKQVIPNGSIEVFEFAENILFADGLVVANNISRSSEDELYKTLRNSFYANIDATSHTSNEKYQVSLYDEYLNNAFRDKFIETYDSIAINSQGAVEFNNFKNNLVEIFKTTINKDLEDEDLLKYNAFVETRILNDPIYKSVFINILELEKEISNEDFITSVSFALSHIDFDNEKWASILENKYQNLENFAFVNYTPSILAEYELVKRNYFINEDNTYDKKAISIFEVNDNGGRTKHKRLSGASEKVQSLLNTYYYLKIKH
ncbi:hypothetical protein [Mycoplasmopsis edwardii]|uniref:Uncharacterized protein n=1 Tax=Mycoplasmopsis edwardii TaxID=53558 RepID=A0ACD4PJK6_9BACT|nr:hypothetical protein [Mycoplasmopsis edwardii]WBP84353.1 hypothetical protein Me_995_000336 [Mycoplasmopsis edwardii]